MPGDRTEKPTPRRQKQAREQGQVARSRDITSGAALLAALAAVAWTAHQFPQSWTRLMGRTLAEAAVPVALNHPHCASFCVLGGAACSRG